MSAPASGGAAHPSTSMAAFVRDLHGRGMRAAPIHIKPESALAHRNGQSMAVFKPSPQKKDRA